MSSIAEKPVKKKSLIRKILIFVLLCFFTWAAILVFIAVQRKNERERPKNSVVLMNGTDYEYRMAIDDNWMLIPAKSERLLLCRPGHHTIDAELPDGSKYHSDFYLLDEIEFDRMGNSLKIINPDLAGLYTAIEAIYSEEGRFLSSKFEFVYDYKPERVVSLYRVHYVFEWLPESLTKNQGTRFYIDNEFKRGVRKYGSLVSLSHEEKLKWIRTEISEKEYMKYLKQVEENIFVTTANTTNQPSVNIDHALSEKAEAGDQEAQYKIALAYEADKKNSKLLAVMWYRKAASQGHIDSQYRLGQIYAKNRLVNESNNWYSKAADQGSAAARYELARNYDVYGNESPRERELALKLYHSSADQGYAEAQARLGWIYKYERGVEHDEKKSMEWYQKAAEQGHVDSMNQLALAYSSGRSSDVMSDFNKALMWYKKAAESGSANAEFSIGRMYEAKADKIPYWQENSERNANLANARTWYKKSADHGDEDAQSRLGIMYKYGIGGNTNIPEANKLLIKVASRDADDFGIRNAYMEACYELGHSFENGIGIPVDIKNAIECYQKAAKWHGFGNRGEARLLELIQCKEKRVGLERVCLELMSGKLTLEKAKEIIIQCNEDMKLQGLLNYYAVYSKDGFTVAVLREKDAIYREKFEGKCYKIVGLTDVQAKDGIIIQVPIIKREEIVEGIHF